MPKIEHQSNSRNEVSVGAGTQRARSPQVSVTSYKDANLSKAERGNRLIRKRNLYVERGSQWLAEEAGEVEEEGEEASQRLSTSGAKPDILRE